MYLWQVKVFANINDTDPIRTGFFYAQSIVDAYSMVAPAMGDAWRADLNVMVIGPNAIPEGLVAWVS